ncbi:tetraacyldisaccharide 4'-kinase [Tropicimonas sp. IMCC34011]|uniref:tetraacyldisaccharide 4'-kinase n=1 Tax=Tropicimonas sp. IMCC34011 TaxID=2248759 RepID=UPI000E226DD4|nr:tetraacyldisaccharide 4'-kinase [Tropicimonas sp. IMCC34011]
MRPPGFWDAPPDAPGWQARALSPLGALYASATARRVRRPGHRAGIPIVSVGNLEAGGTGKTPTVIALLQRIAGAHVVTRGYGGSLEGPVRVDGTRHRAEETGDEPLLLSAFAPVWVSRDRAAGVRAAEAAGATAVILDDAHQNPNVRKDLSIVVTEAARAFGNGRCIPAGPLREPVEAGLARADLLLTIGAPAAQATFGEGWGTLLEEHLPPRITGRIVPLRTGMPWQGLRVYAFAGIGRPAKFFDTLRGLGATLRGAVQLDDHQPLGEALLARLEREALAENAQLVTTEKDMVRLPLSWRGKVMPLPVRLEWEDSAALGPALSRIGLG